jgi:FkbM family methyltransferase
MHIGDISFDCNLPKEFEASGMAKRMRLHTYESDIVTIMKRFLRVGDAFIDVGANVGYLSAVGMSIVGRTGEVHSFEPVPKYYECLHKLATDNTKFKIICNNLAASDLTGMADIVVSSNNPGWNTMVPSFMPKNDIAQIINISTVRLDSYIDHHVRPHKIRLIKIDTEGFELPVLRGLSKYFESGERPIIVCEVAPDAYNNLGYRISHCCPAIS